MNLAFIAAELQTKYLNHIFVVQRGAYDSLAALLVCVILVGLVVPVVAILAFGKRVR